MIHRGGTTAVPMRSCKALLDASKRRSSGCRRKWLVLMLLAVVLMWTGLYVFVLDDSFLSDEQLLDLLPSEWVTFRDNAKPVDSTVVGGHHRHPLLVNVTRSTLRSRSSSGLSQEDMHMLVSRWADLEPVTEIGVVTPSVGIGRAPHRRRKAWNGHRGVFIERFRDGTIVRHDAADGWGHYRLRKQVVRYVEDAISRRVQHHLVFHLGVDDTDLFFILMTYPTSAFAKAVRQIIVDYPELYFVHWNPTMVDVHVGILGPRMIPIPDYEHIYVRKAVGLSKARREFPPGVGDGVSEGGEPSAPPPLFCWRGGTTGAFQNYSESDRAIVVRLMSQNPLLASQSDVKFDGLGGESMTEADHVALRPFVGAHENIREMSRCAFHLDIDGNANSWRGTRWKLASGVPVVKVESPFIQWYYPLLREHQHVLLWSIDSSVSPPEAWPLQYAMKNRSTLRDEFQEEMVGMAERAGRFAEKIFHRKAAEAVVYDMFGHLEFFDHPRSWRIRSGGGEGVVTETLV